MSICEFNLKDKIDELLNTFEYHKICNNPKVAKNASRIRLLQVLGLVGNYDTSFDVQLPSPVTESMILDYLKLKVDEPKAPKSIRLTGKFILNPVKVDICSALTKLVVNREGYYAFAKLCFEEIVRQAITTVHWSCGTTDKDIIPIYKGSTEMKDYLRSTYPEESLHGLYENSDVDTCIMIRPTLENYEEVLRSLQSAVYHYTKEVAAKYESTFIDFIYDTVSLYPGVFAVPGKAQNFYHSGDTLHYEEKYTRTKVYQVNVHISEATQIFNLTRIKIPFHLFGPAMVGVKTLCGEFLDISIVDRKTPGYNEEVAKYF